MVGGKILNAAILSHLAVAVPPAVLLGWMVADINESALRYEVQQLHLSTAHRMKEALTTRVGDTVTQLQHAERVLALDALSLAERQDLLRAMVASGTLAHVSVHRPDGAFDAAIRPGDVEVPARALPEAARARAAELGFAVVGPHEDGRVTIFVPWSQAGAPLGFLSTDLEPNPFRREATTLAATYLGAQGRVEIVDGQGRGVVGTTAPGFAGTPFEGLELEGADGLGRLAAGISKPYTADGEPRLAAVVAAPELGWIVGTSRPVAVAFESLERMRQRVLLISIAAALAAGLVALLLARQVSQPVEALIAAARRVAKGGFSSRASVRARGELGQLADAFNQAIDQLSRYRTELKQTTQLRLRLSRMANGAAVHEALASAQSESQASETVTVLYADVVLPPDAGIDTEHLVTVLAEFFGAVHETMRKHRGVVDRFSGDAVIGIFTGPAPKPAVAAARDLVADAEAVAGRWHEHLGGRFSASVAVVTGPATLSRTAESGELSVSGPLVERAAAAQGRAGAGEVYLDADTARAADAQVRDAGATEDGVALGVLVH